MQKINMALPKDVFRRLHRNAVEHQIPQVAAGEEPGSASPKGETLQYLEKHRMIRQLTR